MPPRSKIQQLPPNVKKWLHQALIENNFSDYELLEKELAELGFKIGKSSINRYGQNLERKLAAIKASTEAATAIAEAAPDDADLRSAAVMSLVQTEVFDVLVQLQEADAQTDPGERLKTLGRAAKSIAELSRASVNQKKWQVETENRIRTEERAKAANEAASAAKDAGASDDTVKKIRAALGVPV